MNKLQNIKLNVGRIIIESIILLLVCQATYWNLVDYVLFNVKTLDYSLGFLYHSMAGFIALTLSLFVLILYGKIPKVGINLMFILAIIYSVVSILNLYSEFCEEDKNIDFFHSILVISLLVLTFILLVFKVLPKMTSVDITIVIITAILFLVDSLFFLIGFKLFYLGV